MTRLAQQLHKDRLARDAARSTFDQRLALVRHDLDARSVGGRVADKLGEDARAIVDEAIDVANAHRGVIAGTVGAIALWLFRDPIFAGIDRLLDRDDD